MNANWKDLARTTLAGAESDTMTFPESARVKEALREAQAQVPGYTYRGFCAKVAAAGCAGYVVSFPGRRVLYHGRTGETHTEYFPGTRPAAES